MSTYSTLQVENQIFPLFMFFFSAFVRVFVVTHLTLTVVPAIVLGPIL